jgi:hypothetical protein
MVVTAFRLYSVSEIAVTSTKVLLLSFLNVSEVFKHVSEKLLLDRIQIQIVQVQGLGRMEE